MPVWIRCMCPQQTDNTEIDFPTFSGIKYLASISLVSSGLYTVECYVFGKLPKYTTHAKIFLVIMTFEALLFIFMIIWQPQSDQVWIFFVLRTAFTVCQSSLRSQIGSIYSRFYPDNKKAGSALVHLWEFSGTAIIFGTSGFLFPFQVLAVNFATCVIGTVLYLIAEKIQNKPNRTCRIC